MDIIALIHNITRIHVSHTCFTHTRSVTYDGSLLIIYIPTERRRKKLIIATTTCISWRHHARARAAASKQRHWADSSPSESAMPFLDMCSDPSTVFRYLSLARYPAPLSPFFPTSLRISLLWPSYCLSFPPSPHLTLSTLENRRSFFSPAESSAASRETAYGAVLSTRQAVHPATSRLTRSRVQPIWFSSLSLFASTCWVSFLLFVPLVRSIGFALPLAALNSHR